MPIGYTILSVHLASLEGSLADPVEQAPYLRYQFKVLKENFNYKKIYLTEFGFAETFSYLRQDLYAILYDTVSSRRVSLDCIDGS